MSSPLREQLLETTRAFLEATNAWTPESVLQRRSADCQQRVLPATLKQPPRDNASYDAFFREVKPLMPDFHVALVPGAEPIVDEVRRKVVLHMQSRAETPTLGPYANEYMIVLTMTDDGKEVRDILEFVDSLYSKEFWSKAGTSMSKKSS